MKQRISPTSPKNKQSDTHRIERIYASELNHLTKPEIKTNPFLQFVVLLFVSIISGALAAVLVLTQAERLGFITNSKPETTIIVRDGAERYAQSESFKQAFIENIEPSVLRLYARTLPQADDTPFRSIISEDSFVGYGVLLTSDGDAVTVNSVMREGESYIAENWQGKFQEVTEIIVDEKSGLTFFSNSGNGLKAVDVMKRSETFPLEPVYIYDRRITYRQAIVSEATVKLQIPDQLLNPDLYIRSSEEYFSRTVLLDQKDFPRGAPVFKGDGSLLGLYDGTIQNPEISFLAERETVISQYLEKNQVEYPFIGVHGIDLSIAESPNDGLKRSHDAGFLLQSSTDGTLQAVVADSPADDAGLQEGDIILTVDNKQVSQFVSFSQLLLDVATRDTIDLRVDRSGEELTVSVVPKTQ